MEQVTMHTHAHYQKVVAYIYRLNNGARRNENDMPCGDGVFLQIDNPVHGALLDISDTEVLKDVRSWGVVDERLQELAHVEHHSQPLLEECLGGELVVFTQHVEYVLQCQELGLFHISEDYITT